ncbi:MAG: sensor histidine kinase [bacterium]
MRVSFFIACLIAGLAVMKYLNRQRDSEEALKVSEARYRAMFENMSNGVAVYEAVNEGEDFIFRDFNRASEKIDRIKREELLGKSVLTVFPGIKSFGLFNVFQRVWKTGEPEFFPVAFYKDERICGWRENYIYKLPSGELVSIYEDASIRKQTEENLRIERDKLLALFDGLARLEIGIDIIGDDYTILFQNQVIKNRFGDGIDKLCYKERMGLNKPCDFCDMHEALKGREIKRIEITPLDGKTYELLKVPLLNQDGSADKVLEVIQDITTRKEAEKKKEHLIKEVTAANQDLKDFAYIVSHDLKAPLRAIATLADWLAIDYADKLDDKGRNQIRLLFGRIERMNNLIDGILQYSRIGHVREDKVEIKLEKLVKDVIDTIKPVGTIDISIETSLPSIFSDPIRISQIFQNLLSNAIKFSDKAKPKITIGCSHIDNFWVFKVADNGPGIEERYFNRIFQIFQTLNPRDKVESTGIGLSLVKKIVGLYGGKVWVESEIGHGTSFYFSLPRETG